MNSPTHEQLTAVQQAMNKAVQHEKQAQWQEAESIYRRLVGQLPNFHPAWHSLGLLAHRFGRLELAIQYLEAAVAIDDTNALYLRNLGEMYRRQGLLEKAVEAGRKACQRAPEDTDAHYNLGLAYTDAEAYAQAIECYHKVIGFNPRHNLAWNNLGSALERQGDREEALKAYEQAIAIEPQHVEAQNNAGAIYSEQGRLDEARVAFEAAIAARPDFVESHHNLSSLKRYTPDDPHLAALEQIYRHRDQLPDHARIRYCFALGKALDDIGEYERAFAAYEEGNRLQHALLPMDEARANQLVETIIARFDADFFAQRKAWQGAADPQRTPIFIVGMPRSGTTLLEQILCSHHSVHGAGELEDLHQAVISATGAWTETPLAERVTRLSEAEIKRLGDDYLQRVWKLSPDSHYITDKMPANFFYLGLIHLALPQAKIIHAMRDPMDSCFSCYTRLFNDTMEFAYDQGTLGRYYVRYMRLMQHWQRVLPEGSILNLAYEEMVSDTETQARRILEFVGLPWDENCLNFHQNTRLVKTASVAQVRKPIYKTSVARWRHFATFLRPLYELVKGYRAADDAEQLFSQLPPPAMPVTLPEAHRLHQQGIAAWQAGQPGEAIRLINQAIALDEKVALFHSNLAEMNRNLGLLEAAIRHGEQAVALDADMATAHSNLGIAYYDSKDYERAETCHQRALALSPQLLQSLNNLGSIARARKDRVGAADWYRKALAVDPDYLESLSNLGAVLVEEDHPDEAELPLLHALQKQPNYPEALCNLGLVRLKQERNREAIGLLQRSLQLRPNYPEAMVGLARGLQAEDKLEEAENLLREVLGLKPDCAEAWCQLGSLYMEQGETTQAKDAYLHALELDPEMADALTGLANIKLEEGEMAQSVELLNRAITLAPDNLAARFHLTQARKVLPCDDNLAMLERKTDDLSKLTEDKRICLHYALGKAYDDLKEYDKAFPHFIEGARLKRGKLHYDADADAARVERIMARVDAEFIQQRLGVGSPSELPVFVLGMPRSGTTLTEQIIASHPQVHGAGELHDLIEVVRQAPAGVTLDYPDNLTGMNAARLHAWGDEYLHRLRKHHATASRITDKMPANYMALGLIPLMLPGARIIHVRRNPVDTCVSCFTRLFNQHQDATYDLYELGRHYANYARLMNHWRSVLPEGSFLEVQYEDIVADMETQARRLIDWVGLDWDDACLSFHKTRRNVRTASVAQVRQPIYSSSVERWRHYEAYLEPLLQGLGEFAP